jgi:Txe/YoeB family toxin of Txe-Axe toxin-antitoxin module
VAFRTSSEFKRAFRRKDKAMQDAIDDCLARFIENPSHPSLHRKKMQGREGVWELRIDGGNRITFRYDKDDVELLNNCNHDILRRP